MAANKRKKKASKKAAKSAAPKKASKKKAAKSAPKKAKKAPKKKAAKAVKVAKVAKAAKAAAPAALTGKKARKSKRGKRARATGKSKQVSGDEDPAPVVDAASVSTLVGRGAKAPPFSLPDQSGSRISSADLRGKPYVLYFYPKDNTGGCTAEACDFQAELAQFAGVGARVVGVSPDSSESHRKFGDKYGLTFTLLADTERKLANDYGVWVMKKNYGKEYMGILRSTFLIDRAGVVQRAWRGVKVAGHVAAVAREVQQLQ